jgi:phosphoribosylanthranilate isomerase
MVRTRIKICGITRPQDAIAAATAGADAIGIVLHAPSKRLVALAEAEKIVAVLPPFVGAVGLFVDADPASILAAARAVGLTAVQLHGNESPQTVVDLAPLRVIKVIHVERGTFLAELQRWSQAIAGGKLSNLRGLLLDTAAGGGSGLANEWNLLEEHLSGLAKLPAWIAAGGLTPQTVGDVVRRLRPWAVDVSSGVESASREKSGELMAAFINSVRDADLQARPC